MTNLRQTPYRVARDGHSPDRWLTKDEALLAKEVEIEAHPTRHGTDGHSFDCPAPEACGWFITRADFDKIKRLQAVAKKELSDQ